MADAEARVEQEKVLLSWVAPSRPFKLRSGQFLTVPMVIAILVGLILLIAGEWMSIAVVAALIFAYYAWSTVKPEEVEFRITTRGVRAHGQLYGWEVLNRWWVMEKWGQKILMVETPVVIASRLVMPLGAKKVEEVTEVLDKYLLREEPAETSMDRMGKWLAEKFPLEEKV